MKNDPLSDGTLVEVANAHKNQTMTFAGPRLQVGAAVRPGEAAAQTKLPKGDQFGG
jgi:hypothetical protein